MKFPSLSDIAKLNPVTLPGQLAGELIGKGIKSTIDSNKPKPQPQQQQNKVDLLTGLEAIANKFKPKGPDLYDKAKGNISPYAQQGLKDYETLGNMVKSGQFNTQVKDFDYMVSPPSDFKFENMPEAYKYQQFQYNPNEDPGTQFRMQQGTAAMNTSAAARGGGLSGAQLKALTNYGQQLGSQEYQNSYNRFMQGQGMQASLAQQNIMNAQQQQAAKYHDYSNRMNQWNTNKNFAYNQFIDKYNNSNLQNQQKYAQMAGLANVGIAAGQNMANIDLAKAGALNAQQAQQAGFANQLQLQQIQNQNQQQLQQNQINAQSKWNDQSAQAGFWNGMLQLGGTLGGALLGGPVGGLIGGSLGGMLGSGYSQPQPQFNYNQYSPQNYIG